ncbi:uncharacterized protein A4U43_C03F7930 [Asparagus officinalis]|uniref:BSD domain-containing protein n=1 Tax=Asparagus officinalis TaxID=4686 RepID=A0A5P1F877_ASPOF|nr:uncharacterized protein LOC109833207 [Asparagus officinalis]ONK74578.1 uncharacterized protein A4U43_C03F7930 [Asparagus officinalis]
MSWFARSLVNSLRGEEEDEDEDNPQSQTNQQNPSKSSIDQQNQQEEDDEDATRGVKEDITELTKTLTRQFWGVASFLAPPPNLRDVPPPDPGQPSDPMASHEADAENSPKLAGIKSDFAEIGGRFKSGISMLSSTKAVSEISKIASTFLPFGLEEDEEGESEETEEKYEGGAVGVTDEVLAFARNISMHPETWLDFPLIPDEDDSDEFDMSDAQQEHALAVEHLAPRLAALRIELCPSHMSEGRFWKIYFVLLHSRLNRADAELLTTPQIVQAREMLLQDLQTRTKPKPAESATDALMQKEVDASVPSEQNVVTSEASAETSSIETLHVEDPSTSLPITDLETEKHPVHTTEVKIIDKSVIEEDQPIQMKTKDLKGTSNTRSIEKSEEDDEDVDDWLEEEETGEASVPKGTTIPLGNDDDVSFSDLEDDGDQGTSNNSKTINHDFKGAAKVGNSTGAQNKESSDWLSIDDLDDINVE